MGGDGKTGGGSPDGMAVQSGQEKDNPPKKNRRERKDHPEREEKKKDPLSESTSGLQEKFLLCVFAKNKYAKPCGASFFLSLEEEREREREKVFPERG